MYMEGASTMTNFDFLKDDPQFSGFADAAIAAERILPIDAATAVLDCRRAMGVCSQMDVFGGQLPRQAVG